jgi:hypothetical protein
MSKSLTVALQRIIILDSKCVKSDECTTLFEGMCAILTNKHMEKLLVAETQYLKDGENSLLRAYMQSKKDEYDLIVIKDICWPQELNDLICLIRSARVHTFVLADSSTALMKTLHTFLSAGFTIVGPTTLMKKNATRWDEPLLGIEIRVNEVSI